MSNLNELKAVFHFKSNERSDYADYNCHFCKNCFIRPHSHYDYYEVLIVIEGEIENVLNGKKILQKVGSVSLLSPSSNHSLNCKEGSLHFNLAVKTRRFEGLIQNKNALKNALNENSYLTTTLSEEAFNYVNKLIGNINNESYDAYNCALVESVLYAVICEFYSELKVSEPQTKIAEYCVDAVNKINNYSYINMQATDVYRLYPVSHTAFIKEFKNLTFIGAHFGGWSIWEEASEETLQYSSYWAPVQVVGIY